MRFAQLLNNKTELVKQTDNILEENPSFPFQLFSTFIFCSTIVKSLVSMGEENACVTVFGDMNHADA